MSRGINDIQVGDFEMPEAGDHPCLCVEATKEMANSGSTGIQLIWATHDGDTRFKDTLWLTAKALGRLALVAKQLCAGADELVLDDDNLLAAKELGDFILEHIKGVNAIVTVVEFTETFIHENGEKIGQTETRKKKKVSFSGYKALNEGCPF